MDRIEKLRSAVLSGTSFSDEFYYLFYKAYSQYESLSEAERYAEAYYTAFSSLTPVIAEGELIVGSRNAPMDAFAEREWKDVYLPIARKRSCPQGQDSHMAIDYELLLKKGISGIIQQINEYMKACTSEQAAFYRACRRCLEAVIAHSLSYARLASEMSRCTSDPERARELADISRICERVPAHPAESFYEAIQSVHFITHCLSLDPLRLCHLQFQLGHPDRYLLSFYENDIQKGVLTREYAQLLLDCLGIQINMRVPHGLSSGYMVGGRDQNGNIVANELTEMCMQVIQDIRLVYPAVGFCHTQDMAERYLEKACSLLLKGYSHPAIFNDDVISRGLMHYGVPAEEARSYIHSTCVEITPVASSNVWVASPYTNMPQILLDSMSREYNCFEDLIDEVMRRLDRRIELNFRRENENRQIRAQRSMNPLLSCFVNDCLKRGTDIEQGGARYNWIMPSFVGMANLVDSLYAVKKLIFDENRMSMAELKAIVDSNFEGHEALRLYILRRLPKYGNDIDEIDRYFGSFTEHIIRECEKYRGLHSNARLIPSVFCWIKHEYFGRRTSATPDGRPAGFPLGDGSGPCQGREMNGPTASVLSSTKWEHHKLIGGVAVNLKFSKASLGAHSLAAVMAIAKTYLMRGGFELQINVIDNETLKKARLQPDQYRDLVVRIGGYSDYFVTLSSQMQDEVIARTEHHV